MRTLLKWLLTILMFMIFTPIICVLQGLITPIEIVVSSIRCRRLITPSEYWAGMSNSMEQYADMMYSVSEEL